MERLLTYQFPACQPMSLPRRCWAMWPSPERSVKCQLRQAAPGGPYGTPESGQTAPGGPYAMPESRQAAFARAARTYGVPESVLLAVSYLESRWDANDGLPSV
ncbi:hypothetical protein CA984_39195, partial [Streptosporangium minutum]